jgi:N6-adenosine-specific RNA methylase IME4
MRESNINEYHKIILHYENFNFGPDRRGVGFYFRNVTEIILFGVRGKNARTLDPGRTQENIIVKSKREHSRKPDEQYELIEACSKGPYLEMFARGTRPKWFVWGNQAEDYFPEWETYKNHSQNEKTQKLLPVTKEYKSPVSKQLQLLDKKTEFKSALNLNK